MDDEVTYGHVSDCDCGGVSRSLENARAMKTDRKLEPTPGWCERAHEIMKCVRALRSAGRPMSREFDDNILLMITEYQRAQMPIATPLASDGRMSAEWCERAVKRMSFMSDGEARDLCIEYEAAKQPAVDEEIPGLQAVRTKLRKHVQPGYDPKPAPLGHEMVDGPIFHYCKHCHTAMGESRVKDPCPARNPQPEAEPEKALGELPERLRPLVNGAERCELPPSLEALAEYLRVPMDRDYARDVFGSLLAECRLIAKDETANQAHKITNYCCAQMREIAREEIAAARIPGMKIERYGEDYELRIVPGEKE